MMTLMLESWRKISLEKKSVFCVVLWKKKKKEFNLKEGRQRKAEKKEEDKVLQFNLQKTVKN